MPCRGVTQHKNNRRYEAHIWDKNMQRTTPGKGGRMKGRQVYLGSYSAAVDAARAHDYAALAFSFEETSLNVSYTISDDSTGVLELFGSLWYHFVWVTILFKWWMDQAA